MTASLETHGDIEVVCDTTALAPGKMARLVFRPVVEVEPPFQVKILAPSGRAILDRVIRALPTGEPQSPPPIAFAVNEGEYKIAIAQLHGSARGEASLRVRR
ncbi:MAG: hypothetical protein HY744_33730 [Deltaproteobacteria bacterium]|nr:hypothetical protein [Deltaproteobacteria bacterium]